MGADLICYIAVGPKRISFDERKTLRLAKEVRKYLDTCIAAAEGVLLGRKDVRDPRQSPVEAKRSVTLHLALSEGDKTPKFRSLDRLRSSPRYQELVRGVLSDCDLDVEAAEVFAGGLQDLASVVRGFVDGWNDGCFRDLSSRPDPDKPRRKIVVAGELSWGDEPEGAGYQMLKKAFALGIARRLGVK
jgi:hypothetical protein